MLHQHCKGTTTSTITLNLYPSIGIGPFSLRISSRKKVGVESLMDKAFSLPLSVGSIYMEEIDEISSLGKEIDKKCISQHFFCMPLSVFFNNWTFNMTIRGVIGLD
ncbi:hypothetical protein CR513_10160, partial [Mucuna pruriens]